MSQKLVFIQNDQALTTSLKVAEVFDKRHDHVMRDIDSIIKQARGVPKIGDTPMFEETTYIQEQNGQTYPMYYLNRDGFTLLAMGFTGKKALEFKLKYIKAFNRMEEKLKQLLAEGKDARWLEMRQQTKETRKAETSTIKLFIEYAKSQGYEGDDKKIYSAVTIETNLTAGLPMKNGRDSASISQLSIVDISENAYEQIFIQGMAEGLHYTRILAQLKDWRRKFIDSAFIASYLNRKVELDHINFL